MGKNKAQVQLKEPQLNPYRSYVEANSFVTAVYDKRLTTIGQKLIRIAVAEADSIHDDDFYAYKVKMSELATLLKMTENEKVHIYRNVKRACKYMATMTIGIEKQSTRINREPSFRWVPLFQLLEYHDDEGWLEIQFNPQMTPYFLHLRENFTKVPLWHILEMDHKYSIRMYELLQLKMFGADKIEDGTRLSPIGKELTIDHKTVRISVKEIRRATDTEGRYKQIGQLRDFVINPAFKDIEEHAGYHCELTTEKEGKKVVGFKVDVWIKSAWNQIQLEKGQVEGQMSLFDFPEFTQSVTGEINPITIHLKQ